MRWLAILGLLVIILMAAWVDIWSLMEFEDNPHVFLADKNQCSICHLLDGEDGIKGDEFGEILIDVCYQCHLAEKLGRSHPVDVDLKRNRRFPDMEVPEELMVGWDDVLACVTCHTVHGSWKSTKKSYPSQQAIDPGGSPAYYRTFFLRIPGDPQEGWAGLCDACHGLL